MELEQNNSSPANANGGDGLTAAGNICCRLLAGVMVIAALLATAPSPAHAAITYFASASNPTDGNSLDLTAVPVTPPGSMLAGDLVILVANAREAGNTLTISATGGQAWTSQTANTTNASSAIFWARYNGTWASDPSVSFPGTANGTTVAMHVFRPSSGSNTWALDVAQTNGSFSAPGGSHDVTIGGITTVTNGALVFASWISNDNNSWGIQTAGWANAGGAQYRNGDGSDASQSSAYKVMPAAGASGNVTNRQTALGGDPGNTSILAFKEVPITTLATGADPAANTIGPGAAATDVDFFTLQTSSGTEAITSVTVNLSTASGVAVLAITDNAGTVLGSTASPAAGSNTISVAGLTATTTLTTFKVRVTPLSHAAMPAPPGAAYAITAPVTAWAGPNTHAGSDTNTTALTIDNLSPSGATATSSSAGNLQNTLNWTTSASADFNTTSGSVVYRWAAASAGAEVPAEGSTPSAGNTNGTATVACVISSAASTAQSKIDGSGGSAGCTTTALTAGQAYTYKVFQKDANGNYDVGVAQGSVTPFGTTTLATGTDPAAATVAPGAAATDVDLFTFQTNSGTEAVTSVTVNLSTANGIALLAITDNAGTVLGSTASPAAGSNTISVAGLTATTTLTTFKVRVTPLSHAAMPAPPGAAYAITAPVTAWAGPNTHAGPDTNTTALTIDNLSPNGATATSGTAGTRANTLNWTTSNSGDFTATSGSVVYRWAAASAGAEVPAEGSTPSAGNTNGTATVACVISSAASTAQSKIDGSGGSAGCTTTALTAGQAYTYKVFQKDANGNYDVGVSIGPLTPAGTITLGDGTNPSNVTLAPSGSITDLDAFTLATDSGTNNVTALTVTLTGANSFQGLSEVRITDSAGTTTYFTAVANPASNTIAFSGGTAIPVTTTATTYKVRITPKTHANMPVPPGATYTVGGTVTAFTSTYGQTGTDGASATITVDNLSPNGATATSGTTGNQKVTLNWTTSNSGDFATTSGSVIYRWAAASAGAEVPAEGSTPTIGATNGTATVACLVSSAASTALTRIEGAGGSADCNTTSLTAGQVYSYKVFQKDSNGNYDVGVAIGSFTPAGTITLADGTNPGNTTLAPGASITDLDSFTFATSTGTDNVTALTVTLTGTNAFQSLSEVRITSSDGATTYFSAAANPGSNTVSFSGGTPIPVTSTATTFKVRITPKTHINMPVPPGASYDVGGTVTAFTSTFAQVGTDFSSATVTVDNLSPSGATATSGVTGNSQTTLNWTTSASSDFTTSSGTVIYRWAAASAGSEVPVEGSTPAFGATNGTATVACVVSSSASTALSRIDGPGSSSGECTTAALATGQAYTYKVFQKDSSGNYDVGVTMGTITPYGAVSAATSTVVASPTSVAADNITTTTITVTLKDSAGTAVPGKTVTLAAGSGSSVIATLNGTTDASGAATFSAKDGTVEGPLTYTATDTTDSITITQTAQVTFITPSLCFTDDFNRTTGLLSTSNWTRTKSVGTTFDAEIVNNRLRLTDAAGTRATAVHLQRMFPGAGNKVVAEFDYFAYNGNGADGLAMTLSDSSIAPVAGAFGGSLGYAQKSNPGSDCTTVGGCPGFAGGWIGIGLDEFGNYSNATEGRVDGPGFQADSITIRGSGSGQSGYNFHTRVAAPGGIDSTVAQTPPAAAPGHRYKITVDHSDGVHAYVSVDRDTTGLGTSYTNLVPAYDAKAIPTQAAVPPYWFFSFTASTGGSTNIHEIDNLKVCTAQPVVVPVLNHVRIIHDGNALTCAPETITLKACATADCSALYTGSVTVDLTNIGGATWSSDPVTFSGGQTQVTLTKATTGTVTLGGAVTTPTITPTAAVCYNGSTSGNCSLTYSSNACAFDAVETGQNPSTPIFTKLAGTAFTVDVLALTAGVLNTGYTGTVSVDLVDQTGVSAGSCGTTSLASPTSPASPYTFVAGNAGRRTFTFNYAGAAKDVRVRMTSGATTACSSDNFAIRPTSFGVSLATTAPIKAGTNFELDASPANASAGAANGYTGTAQINNNRVEAHAGATQNGILSGVFSPATSATSWISKGTAFTYSEVGNFRFGPWGVYDDGSFADVDKSKATPECVIDNKLGSTVNPADPNAINANGKYGCYFGGATNSAYFGRFTPDHFAITPVSVGSGCGSFTYFGQDGFTTVFTLTAQNAANATTANYVDAGGWAKLPLTAWGAAPATAASPGFGFAVSAWAPSQPSGASLAASATAPTASNANTWVAGTTTVTAQHKIVRPTNPAVPTTVAISALPVDSDGVTMSAAAAVGTSNPEQRFGILRVDNAYGSELMPIRVAARAMYCNAVSGTTCTQWRTNAADSCTSFTPASGTLANYQAPASVTNPLASTNFRITGVDTNTASGTTGNWMSTANPVTLTSGSGSIILNKPCVGGPGAACSRAVGSVDLTLDLATNLPWLQGTWTSGGSWNQNPTARLKFGSAKAPYIYLRERY